MKCSKKFNLERENLSIAQSILSRNVSIDECAELLFEGNNPSCHSQGI